mgnify:CR=1 FL=1
MHLIYRWSLVALRAGFVPYWVPHLRGLENVPQQGGVILVCNHPTVLDGLILGSVLPRQIRFLISQEPLRVPGVGWWLKALGFIPVGKGVAAMDVAQACLAQGDCLGIFPEAVPTHSYTLKPFRTGVAVLAQKSGVPIIPVTIYGSEELCPGDAKMVRGGPVLIQFGQPFYWQSSDTVEDFLSRLRSAIEAPLLAPRPQLPRPKGLKHSLLKAVWQPVSWAFLKLADWARPGGVR